MNFLGSMGIWLALVASAPTDKIASGGEFEISRSALAGGGGRSSGGQFVIEGTAGQAEAAGALSGGRFVLTPGFWGVAGSDLIFQDAFEVSP